MHALLTQLCPHAELLAQQVKRPHQTDADNTRQRIHTIASSEMTELSSDDAVQLRRAFFVDQCRLFCLRQQSNLPLHVYQTARARIVQPVAVQFFLLMQDIDNQMLYRVVCR